MAGTNQQKVIDCLKKNPHHEATENDIKSSLPGKNWKKVIASMVKNKTIKYDPITKKYTLIATSTASTAPAATGATHSFAVLSYLKAHTPLTIDPTSGLVELTSANASIVSHYIPLGIPGLAKKYIAHAHHAYSRLAGGNPASFNFRNYNDVKAVIAQIDKDNGTLDNKNHNGSAIEAFTQFIIDPINDFERRLDGSTLVIKQLVDDLLGYYLAMPSSYCAKSLASKVCKYFHEYRYGHDKFFINDSVVRKMLPYYCDMYGIAHPTKKSIETLSYSDLFDLLALVYSHCSSDITKSEFDHILWYCYRK